MHVLPRLVGRGGDCWGGPAVRLVLIVVESIRPRCSSCPAASGGAVNGNVIGLVIGGSVWHIHEIPLRTHCKHIAMSHLAQYISVGSLHISQG